MLQANLYQASDAVTKLRRVSRTLLGRNGGPPFRSAKLDGAEPHGTGVPGAERFLLERWESEGGALGCGRTEPVTRPGDGVE